MTLKEYASSRGIPYDTVRKQFQKFRPFLEENISKKGRASDLDKKAVEFLDSKQKSKPMAVLHREQMYLLKKDMEALKVRLAFMEKQVLDLKNELCKVEKEKESRKQNKKQNSWFKRLFKKSVLKKN